MRIGELVLACVTLVACSSGTTSSGADGGGDCNAIADEIRDAAIKRGYDGNKDGMPDGQGVCADTDAQIQKDFATACARVKACTMGTRRGTTGFGALALALGILVA